MHKIETTPASFEKIFEIYFNTRVKPNLQTQGLILYKQHKADQREFYISTRYARYKISGNNAVYNVTINDFHDKLTTTCDCLFGRSGSSCKHAVAAVYHLGNQLGIALPGIKTEDNFGNSSIIIKRNDATAYAIKNYEELNEHSLKAHFEELTLRRAFINQPQFKIEKLVPPELHVSVKEGFWQQQGATVLLKLYPDKGLFVTCNCNAIPAKLCIHGIILLQQMFKWNSLPLQKRGNTLKGYWENEKIPLNSGKFYSLLLPGYAETLKSEFLKLFGLAEIISFEDYFTLEITVHGPVFHPTKKGEGLQRPKSFRSNPEMENFERLFQPSENKFAADTVLSEEEDRNTKALGFALSFHGNSSDRKYRICPLIGKVKQTKDGQRQLTHIQELANAYADVSPSEEEEKLLDISSILSEDAGELHTRFSAIGNTDTRQKYYHDKLISAFSLLARHPFVYKARGAFNGHNEIRKSDLTPVRVSPVRPELVFTFSQEDDLLLLKAQLLAGEEKMELMLNREDDGETLLFTELNGTLYLNKSISQSQAIAYFKTNPVIKIVKSELDDFFENRVKPVAKYFPVFIESLPHVELRSVKLTVQSKRLYITESGNFFLFKPVIVYEHERIVNILSETTLLEKHHSAIIRYERDKETENNIISLVKALHPRFAGEEGNDFFYLPAEEMLKDSWFFDFFGKLREQNMEVYGLEQLKKFRYSPYKAEIKVYLVSGEDWFEVHSSVAFGDTSVSLKDIRKALKNNERYIKLSDGSLGMLPEEWIEKFKKYFTHGTVEDEVIRISKLKFSIIDELFEKIDDAEIRRELSEKKNKLLSFREIKSVTIPKGIKAGLRDYQKEGLNWLNFLHDFRWGGILADDMGLGKTLQVLSFIKKISGNSKAASLVVVPTSLMFNWENEIRKFAPGTKALFYHGNDRIKEQEQFNGYHLVFTTYGLMARDVEVLSKYKFSYIILDESQSIKNPLSQRYKAACLLRADNRIALTGTPIENNTFDLYAQMNFVNPGFLGSPADFKTIYSIPIDKYRDENRALELQRMISPFILRRTKQQVAKDLPEKTEDILYCTMEEEQRKTYDAWRNKYRDYLMKKIQDDGLEKSKMYVLEGLLRLRQICDSPQLISGEEEFTDESVKIKELLRHIKEKTGNHKLLVFSQFVKMLELIRVRLKEEKIDYEYLDGQSAPQMREASVNRFHTASGCRVFLISLKAGGFGLNLTAADYVYIVDPWWNPAVENQAIDRCHRIGQDKKVIAYRMICKDSVEEKILNYQAKKKQVASDIIQSEESFMKQLSKDDIAQIFE